MYRAIFFILVLSLSGCDNFSQSIEDFIAHQTGVVRLEDWDLGTSGSIVLEDGSIRIPPAAASSPEFILDLNLHNSQGYDLGYVVLNNGIAPDPAAIWVEGGDSNRVFIHIAGAQPGDTYTLTLKLGTTDGWRSFTDIIIPPIICVSEDTPPPPAADKAITAFSITSPVMAVGVIDEAAVPRTVAVAAPYGTVVSSMTASVTHTGMTIAQSGGTALSVSPAVFTNLDFTSPVTYTVTAENNSTADYVVTVTPALSGAKAITGFTLAGESGTINEDAHTIAVTVPYGTNVTSLAPALTHTGASINPDTGVAQDFSAPQTYTVTAADGTTQPYIVTVTTAADTTVYTITINTASPANGTVTAAIAGTPVTTAAAGAQLTLTLTPNSGYTLTSAGYTDGVATIPLVAGSNLITMPAADITVTAVFAETVSAVAMRGTIPYASLKEAIDAVPAGGAGSSDEITLLQSIILPEGTGTTGYTITGGRQIRLVPKAGSVVTITRRKDPIEFTDSLFTISAGTALYLGFDTPGGSGELIIDGNHADPGYIWASAALITVDGGTLNMYDGVTLRNNWNTNYSNRGGGVYVKSSGVFNLYGGKISENNAANTTFGGGGVYIGAGSTFNMSGGTIADNFASSDTTSTDLNNYGNGGQVYLAGGSFTMSAGTIGGSSLSSPGYNANRGGGVYAVGGSFSMTGGTIRSNRADHGGGVYVEGITFNMSGGTIGGNGSGEGNAASLGNGVFLFDSGEFAMSGNSAMIGNGVYVDSTCKFSMEGGAAVAHGDWVYLRLNTFITIRGNLTGRIPVAAIRVATASWGSTRVLAGTGTLIRDNKDRFNIYLSPNTYSGSTHIDDSGIMIGP
ncbi:DUF5018 domain-containing protein [Treponema primitia]|uniref:DUF5018 domain-containing protein n=1 Tax=Treponema primitia TaxID=88058 RepID=UPI0002555176|nr:DUF5018 domain-containing protein [Treponema primitia]